jgi:hypothetical protein
MNGAPFRKATGLARQHRHLVPEVVYRLAAAEVARVLAHDQTVLAKDDVVGIGRNLELALV